MGSWARKAEGDASEAAGTRQADGVLAAMAQDGGRYGVLDGGAGLNPHFPFGAPYLPFCLFLPLRSRICIAHIRAAMETRTTRR